LNNAAGNFISPTERLSANAFDTVIDIVLKDLKIVLSLWKTLDRYQTNLFHYFKYCDYLCLYRFCLCCASATAKRSSGHDKSLAVEWGKFRSNAIAPDHSQPKGAWDRLLPGDLAEKFDMAKKGSRATRGRPSGINLPIWFLISLLNGEVVVIDGGEWLKALENSTCLKIFLRSFGTKWK
jgi:hypothetical protein